MNLIPKKYFLDDMFDDFFKDNSMKCDVYEKDNKYHIEMDIPGFDKDDINIDYDNGYLKISASKEEEKDDSTKTYLKKERYQGRIERQFYLGDIDEDDIDASFKNGMLKLVISKKEQIETKKRIEIK